MSHDHVHAHDHAHGRGREPHHGHDHEHGPVHADWGADPRSLEHPDERTDALAHVPGAGRAWKKGDPIPAPILSSRPVRSRTAGRWNGDGM